SLYNSGIVAPGYPLGALHVINGEYGQTFNGLEGHLQIEIGGNTAGTQYDQLLVSGPVTLAGTLDVSFVNGFVPQLGNNFNILDFNGLTGKFNTINLPAIGPQLMWCTAKLYIDGTLIITVPGDYDGNGVVDAADYVMWRQQAGQTGAGLAADGNR